MVKQTAILESETRGLVNGRSTAPGVLFSRTPTQTNPPDIERRNI